MSLSDPNRLSDLVQRGPRTIEEEAQLQAYLELRPEERGAWEEEVNLTSLLKQLPAVPVSSNFTARVLNAVPSLPATRSTTAAAWREALLFRSWIPKLCGASAILCLGLGLYHHHQVAQREALARDVAALARIADQAPVDLLRDFDAIQRLGQVPRQDNRALIAALQ